MILITGASGRIGRLTAELLAHSGHTLRLMTRTPENAPKLEEAEIIRGDFAAPHTLDAAFAGIAAALVISRSATPGERALLHRNAFQAAARSHVRHVVYLSLQGAGPQSKFPFSRDHYLSEQFLAAAGLPSFTILRNGFYMDMFLEMFSADGVVRGPAGAGQAASVSRVDVARVAAAVLASQPGGIHDVTGPEAVSVEEAANRLSVLAGRSLHYEYESSEMMRERLIRRGAETWRADLAVGWFEAIAAGELRRISATVQRFTGTEPLTFESYFSAFPALLSSLRLTHDQS